MDKLRIGIRWGIRAMRYEEKLRRSREENIIKKCWREIVKGKREETYGKERKSFYIGNGWGLEAIENIRNEDIKLEESIVKRERDQQRQ